jgi:hypothetical protein
MDAQELEAFRTRFRAWLGPDLEAGARIAARRSGYSLKYIRWAAGLIGRKPWPGSRPFVRRMVALGCSDVPWCDRSPEELAQAFQEREVLHDPGAES